MTNWETFWKNVVLDILLVLFIWRRKDLYNLVGKTNFTFYAYWCLEVILVPSNASKCTVAILSDGVVLNNLTIYGGEESQAVSVFGSHASILNCNILNGAVGVYLFGSSNSSLINNTISSSDYGVYADNSDNNSVLFNWIKDNWYGIVTSGSSYNVFEGNFIFDNWIGVEESSCSNRYISNNVYDNVEGIFINDGVNSSFKDNFVFGNYIGLFNYDKEENMGVGVPPKGKYMLGMVIS